MDSIEKPISVINQMVDDGIIESYALGGATAVIFYTEPIATQDIDTFVNVQSSENVLMEFQPMFDYLKERGYEIKAEHVYIEGFPVQFLPVTKGLIDNAVQEAYEFKFSNGVVVRVMTPEHLVAIMLETGRTKDYLRISIFLQHGIVNMEKLQPILTKYNLAQKWQENAYRFQP